MNIIEIDWDEHEKNAAKKGTLPNSGRVTTCTSCGGTGAQCHFASTELMYGSIADPEQTCGTCNGTGFMPLQNS